MVQTWPGERAANGGADEIPLAEGPGRLWLCGKHFIGPDHLAALARIGAERVVCLCERHELADRYPGYVAWLDSDPAAVWFPIHDLHAPSVARAGELIDRLHSMTRAGDRVLMHCGAGIGRAGTMAAALLIDMGVGIDEARATVAASRPMAGPEAGAQEDLLVALDRIRAGSPPPSAS